MDAPTCSAPRLPLPCVCSGSGSEPAPGPGPPWGPSVHAVSPQSQLGCHFFPEASWWLCVEPAQLSAVSLNSPPTWLVGLDSMRTPYVPRRQK